MLKHVLFAFVLGLFCLFVSNPAQSCSPPAIVANTNANNIFSPEQEMILGELTIENMSGELRLVRDEQLVAYVNEIAGKLIRHLPQIGLKYTFHIIDMPENNAFNIPGGHVFLSRKLISFAKNEDELAGVMAHELGHATVRHGAQDMSTWFRKVLNISALGDRKDIREKYNLLIENARTKQVSQSGGHEDAQQLEADKIGVFALVAAGYDPMAFTSFFDRLTENNGKTGNWFSNVFGKMRPEQKRLREMTRAIEQLPQSCRDGKSAAATENFLKWQADVVSFHEKQRPEELPGLSWKKELTTKLRSDVSRINFSLDGRLLLAQDDFSITVMEREPQLRVLFQIPTDGADPASFTPDGQFIVFTDRNLRYERWNVADKKPTEIRELVVRDECWEHKLSPDGNYLACVDTAITATLIETKTGKKVWEKKEFYPLNFFEYITWLEKSDDENATNDDDPVGFFRIEYSPDSRFVMFSRSNKYRFRFSVDAMTIANSENTALAFDLLNLKPVDVGGDLKKLSSRAYIFLDSERVLGNPSQKLEDGGVFLFPNGKRLKKFDFAAKSLKRTSNPDFIILKPVSNASMGVLDISKTAIITGMNKADADIWNNLFVFESTSGLIQMREVQYSETEKSLNGKNVSALDIPVGSIADLKSASISNNLKWMILSSKTRGGLWNLETGERKLLTRGFKGSVIDEKGNAIGDFPKMLDNQHSLVLMNPSDNQTAVVSELPERGAHQYGRFILTRRSLKEKPDEKNKDKKPNAPANEGNESDLQQEVKFELQDLVQGKVIWSRDFPKAAPRYSFDEYSGRLLFYWQLGSESGKKKLKENPELQAKASALGNKDDDYMVEVIDAYSQQTIGTILLETGKGSFSIKTGLSEANWLMLYDSEGRVLVYSLKEGKLEHRFFGKNAALNPSKNMVAVENFPGEINLYNLETGESQAKFIFNGKAAFVRFNLEGNKLFVLSDAQVAYAFDLSKFLTVPIK